MACPLDEDAAPESSSSGMKRSPLTPIPVDGHPRTDDNLKLIHSLSYPSVARSHSDDDLRHRPLYQRRKSSVPSLTLARLPYHRRKSHNRRPSPARNSPGLPASLIPIHPNFNSERRTSLPALHFHETVKNAGGLRLDTRTPPRRDSISEDMYGNLQTFTFGAPPRHATRDSDDSDEDERQRCDRAKMRAIDDGTRRPSLPTNSSTPVGPRSQPSIASMSSAGIVVGERQWEEHSEPDWDIAMGDTTPTKSSPPPPTLSSGSESIRSEPRRPSIPIAIPMLRRRSRSADELAIDFIGMRGSTPTQTTLSTSQPLFSWVDRPHSRNDQRGTSSSPEEDAYDGFNLDYIYEPAGATGATEADPNVKRQQPSGRLRARFFTKAPHPPPRVEDTFNKHVQEFDPLYQHRKAEWSFRREARPGHNASAAKGKDKQPGKPNEEQEHWRCEWVGRFTVIKVKSDKPPPVGSDAPKPTCNRLQIIHQADPINKGNTQGGPRVLVHRHSRAKAFSIFRGHIHAKKAAMVSADSVLMAIKSVLREYTRTESTRALRTHGLTDDGDATRPHPHPQQQQSRSGSGSSGGSPQERSRSESRVRETTVHESEAHTASTSGDKRSSLSGSTRSGKHSSHKSQSQSPEARSRKTSTTASTSASRPTTASSSTATSTSRPSSLALTRSSPTHVNSSTASSSVEYVPPVPRWEPPSPTSPRLSTSHAEAFAMRDLGPREPDWSHHHRNDSGRLAHISSAAPSRQHAAQHPTPSPPHNQRSAFGFGERIKRAFGSSKQAQPSKDQKEPGSPSTDDGEEEPKTANQEAKFVAPWLTVVRRSEKEQQDRMIRTLNDSFESVGLIPPQDKKKSSKPRSQKSSRGEECAVFEEVPDDSMCMLLPLWPGETAVTDHSALHSLSRTSSRNARHTTTQSLGNAPITATIPLQERKFLLVYYVPFDLESPTEDGTNGGANNKKRRRPQTAGERPQHNHNHHVKMPGGPGSFRVVARLLAYNDVRSSGVRLPEKGLVVTGALDEAAMGVPPHPPLGADPQVIAQCFGAENGVELVQEGLDKLGLMDPTAPRNLDVNGDVTSVPLSEVGRAIVEMVWCGCVSLMAFAS